MLSTLRVYFLTTFKYTIPFKKIITPIETWLLIKDTVDLILCYLYSSWSLRSTLMASFTICASITKMVKVILPVESETGASVESWGKEQERHFKIVTHFGARFYPWANQQTIVWALFKPAFTLPQLQSTEESWRVVWKHWVRLDHSHMVLASFTKPSEREDSNRNTERAWNAWKKETDISCPDEPWSC